jgi:hypothetical protein
MRGNQFKSTGAKRNLNVRIAPALRERIDAAVSKYKDFDKTAADIVRDALELYLPILEASTVGDSAEAPT